MVAIAPRRKLLTLAAVTNGRRQWLSVLRVSVVAAALGLIAATFRDVEFERVGILFGAAGPALAWVVVPMGVSLFIESAGWAAAFRGSGRRVPLLGLFRVRVTSEALALTLPAGMLFCESTKPFLLATHCGLEPEASIAGMAARKYLLLVSQAAYISGFALLGAAQLEQASAYLFAAPGLSSAVLVVGVLVGASAAGCALLLHRGRLGQRAFAGLSRLPVRALRALLERNRARFAQTDGELRKYFVRASATTPLCAPLFLAAWVLEAVETYLILRLLGVELSFGAVGAIEVTVSFLRHVSFVLPAGIGVQDLGYVTFLYAAGVRDPLIVGAGFTLTKRAKEGAWALLGYVLLAADLRSARSLAAAGGATAAYAAPRLEADVA